MLSTEIKNQSRTKLGAGEGQASRKNGVKEEGVGKEKQKDFLLSAKTYQLIRGQVHELVHGWGPLAPP